MTGGSALSGRVPSAFPSRNEFLLGIEDGIVRNGFNSLLTLLLNTLTPKQSQPRICRSPKASAPGGGEGGVAAAEQMAH